MIGYCGLDCNKCRAFIATINNDNKLRVKTARQWTQRYKLTHPERPPLKASDINCFGCLSNGPFYIYCEDCQIRQCAIAKKLNNCNECKDYKCDNLIKRQKSFS